MDTLKKNIITSYGAIPFVEGMERNELILFTAAGRIHGTMPKDDTDSYIVRVIGELAQDYRDERKIPDDVLLDGNDGFLILENVTLYKDSTTINFPSLTVFFDQIIAVTIGNIH